ncbi:RHTO0S21e00144g1_1 [Rhodotorula toruloides]|uniref:RHTO0S21e00144g1_1 n=1 Tax=Rhodotorula toruloides TaxID=5286 RepID=A0A061BFT3_RHOTO|nr:RHTO0S21e00144g1_1 [Rhodotorula toruloides]
MDTWESSNRFAILQRDATDPPPPPAPAVRSYAAAAAAARPDAPPEPPAAPRPSAPPKPAPRTSLIAGTADLPATHFLRALPEHRILPCVRKMLVSSSLDPSTLVYARRMERGDVQLVTRGPSAADLLRRALSAYSAEILVKMPVEATLLVLHWVPVDADEVEVREKVEEWFGEGKVAGARWLSRRADKSYGSWLVELCNAEDVSVILRKAVRQLRPGVWVELERAKSVAERRAEASKQANRANAPLGPGTRTSTPVHNSAAPFPSPVPTIPAPPRTPPRSTGYATMISGFLGTAASAGKPNNSSRMMVDESSADGPSRFLETPSRASLIPLPRSPTPTVDDLRPEPVADWSMDVEEEEGGREARGESEGEEDMSTETDGAAGGVSEKDGRKTEEKRSEAKKGEGEEAPKGRESRRLALREKNLPQTEGARRLVIRGRAATPPQPAAAAFASEEVNEDEPPFMSELVIVTYNIHRSPDIWTQLVNSPALWRVDVLLLQEVPKSLHPLPRGWSLVLPPPVTYTTNEPTHPRSAALVSPRFPPSAFSQLPVMWRDVVGVDLRVNERESVRIIGVYNPCAGGRSPPNRSVRDVLPAILASLPAQNTLIIAGDFNLHQPSWDSSVLEADDDAEEARLTFEDAGLVHLHEAEEATWASSRSSRVLDLVLGNLRAEEKLVSSMIDEALEYGSDHRPIRTVLAFEQTDRSPAYPRRLFRKADPAAILRTYARLATSSTAPDDFLTPTDIDAEAETLDLLLRETVSSAVPLAKPSHSRFAHCWWSAEVAGAADDARRATTRAYRTKARVGEGEEADTATRAAKVATNKAKALIRREKRRAERAEVEEVNEASLWKVVKRVLGEGGSAAASTPPLKKDDGTYATSPTDKLALLQPVLLPVVEPQVAEQEPMDKGIGRTVSGLQVGHQFVVLPATSPTDDRHASEHKRTSAEPPASRSYQADPDDADDASAVEREWPDLQEHEVESALRLARPFAASGPDGVPNFGLQAVWPALKARLVLLLTASLRLGHLPTSWRDATGVVLKKPKKDDYSLTKSYRLICFERCISKLLESIVARRITHLADSLKLLPRNHFGARPGRSAEDAVVCFVDEIRRQWRNGNVVLGIALDVAKAFPSVRTKVLVRDMAEKGLPRSLLRWVESFMTSRTCTLRLEGVSSEPVEWRSGLPQGSPLSPILFLLYNSGALDACETPTSTAFGWVDDLNVLTWGRNVEEAVSAAQRIVPGLETWSATHHSLFEPSNTLVTRFLTARDRSPDDPKVVLCGEELEYSSALGMLGVTIDERLTFKQHIASCAAKASRAMVGVGLLAKSRGGLKAKYVRRLVEAVVLPRLTWCAAAWYKPGTIGSKVLEQVQEAAARFVTGGYRTTSLAALEVEANLLPLDLRLTHQVLRLALRLASSPSDSALHARFRLARPAMPAKHPSPIHLALHSFPALLQPRTRVEPIAYSPLAPWASPPRCRLVVDVSKEASVKSHGREVLALDAAGGLAAYSDGSLLESRAGASAVVRFGAGEEGLWGKKARAMGQYQSVYAAELEGARLALDGLQQSLSSIPASSATLFIDNHRTVRSTRPPRDHPAAQLTLQWLAGHLEVPGNELADEEAKRAAGVGDDEVGKSKGGLAGGRGGRRGGLKVFRPHSSSSSSSSADESGWEEDEEERATCLEREVARLGRLDSSTLAGPDGLVKGGILLPKSLSLLKQAHRAVLLAEWTRRWTLSSSPGAGLRAVDARSPGPPFVRALHSLDRVHTILLARLRLDFNDLGSSKARMGLGTGLCECGEAVETRQHYILECSLYTDERQQLRHEIGSLNLKMDKIFSPRFFRPLLRFILASYRFSQLYAPLPSVAAEASGGSPS